MALRHTSVNVIVGATGSGKTTLIRALVALRPQAERWSVLTNDFGAARLASGPSMLSEHVNAREVAGCICCTGQLVLRTALVSLLRETRPDRVLIEASAAAQPAAISALLTAPTFASALEARAVIAAASVSHLTDPRYVRVPVYREQISAADVVVLTEPTGETAEERDAARAALREIVSARTRVIEGAPQVGLRALDSQRT
jgi:G3E family GTPase